MSRFRWVEPPLCADEHWNSTDSPLLSSILANRGLTTAEDVESFLSPSLDQLADPYLLPDMDLAVERIRKAIAAGELVAVFGDYDVDGITSTATLSRALDRLGARSITRLPHRERDGYGLNTAAIDEITKQGASLLIALDCGTSDHTELAHAQQLGLTTIVVDHHHIGESSLPGTAFVSPQRADSRYPFRDLAAVGVTYHLVRALLGDDEASEFLPLVALGTVADVVPLVADNRVLTSIGLRRFAQSGPIGLRSLALSSGLDPSAITSRHCGFVLGPRINAAGRMADPTIALELLLTDDESRADQLAFELGKLNSERQRKVQQMLDVAETKAAANGEAAPLLVVGGDDWSVGLVGLVAGRLTERFNRPSLAFSMGAEVSRGSARSIEGFNIVEALAACEDILVEHGGHSRAAGLTIQTRNLVELEARLIGLSDRTFGGTPPAPTLEIDAELYGRELSVDTAGLIAQLEPFGQGNPSPRFLVRAVRVSSPRRTRNGKHLQFDVETASGSGARAIYFNGGDELPQFFSRKPMDLVFELKLDSWNGRNQVSMEVLDYRTSETMSIA
ncbi:MAG: single-stranded-DNA-specific exonuclease RecJ [Nitrolancea sp.]